MDNLKHNENDILPEENLIEHRELELPVSENLPDNEGMPDLMTAAVSLDEMSDDDIWDEEFFRRLGIDLTAPETPEQAKEAVDPAEESAVYVDEPPAMEDPKLQPEQKEEKLPWQKSVLLYMHDLVYLLAVVIIVFLLLFRVVVVSGSSMNKTLYNGDYLLLVSNIFYHEPKQGDIIVASKDSFKDGAPVVKRVIATEGQWVHIDFAEGIVYVGDDPQSMQPLEEPYIYGKTTTDEGMKFPLVVDEGCVFVLGDNRNDSKDSRHPEIGLIDEREIMGKVVFLFLPGKDRSGEMDFGRIGVIS